MIINERASVIMFTGLARPLYFYLELAESVIAILTLTITINSKIIPSVGQGAGGDPEDLEP